MDQKIKSITEAYSTQPVTISVYRTTFDADLGDNARRRLIREIRLEAVVIGEKNGEYTEELYYVAYNFLGERRYMYLANAVNVEFL